MKDNAIIINSPRSYRAAMKSMADAGEQDVGRWSDRRIEISRLHLQRQKHAMLQFRQMKSLRDFTFFHASGHGHIGPRRHLVDQQS